MSRNRLRGSRIEKWHPPVLVRAILSTLGGLLSLLSWGRRALAFDLVEALSSVVCSLVGGVFRFTPLVKRYEPDKKARGNLAVCTAVYITSTTVQYSIVVVVRVLVQGGILHYRAPNSSTKHAQQAHLLPFLPPLCPP